MGKISAVDMQALHKLASLLIILLAFQLPKSVPAHLSNSINCPLQIQGSLFAFNCTRLPVQKWHNHILTAGVMRPKVETPDRGQAAPTIQQPTVAKGIATGFSAAISYCSFAKNWESRF